MGMNSYVRGLIAGMQFSQRVCKNRMQDVKEWRKGCLREDERDVRINEAQTCAGIIRIAQVAIGSGQVPLPEFTLEEQEQMNRIR